MARARPAETEVIDVMVCVPLSNFHHCSWLAELFSHGSSPAVMLWRLFQVPLASCTIDHGSGTRQRPVASFLSMNTVSSGWLRTGSAVQTRVSSVG